MPIGSYSAYAALIEIKEHQGITKAETMIRELLGDQEVIIRNAQARYPLVGQANDEATAVLLTQRIQLHEKNA